MMWTGQDWALLVGAIGTLITALTSSAAVILSAMGRNQSKANSEAIQDNTRKTEETVAAVHAVAEKTEQTAAAINEVAKQTNSLKDELVASTAKASHAEGMAEGRKEGRTDERGEQQDREDREDERNDKANKT